MPHHGHSTIILIVRVGGIVGELPTCGSRLTFLFSTLLLMVTELGIVAAFHGVGLPAWSGMKTPPSSECSTVVPAFLPKVRVSLM